MQSIPVNVAAPYPSQSIYAIEQSQSYPWCVVRECHSNVLKTIAKLGGSPVIGYALEWQWGDDGVVGLILRHHSLWKNPKGRFIEVTHSKVPFLFIPLADQSTPPWMIADVELPFPCITNSN